VNYKLCQQIVWLDHEHHKNSYCMREVGHAGKHNPDGNFEPVDPKPTPDTKG
jgi:hypothetical protein